MHSAPAVSYPVGRSSLREACLLLPWLLAGLVCAAWTLQAASFSAAQGLALLLWLGVAWRLLAELRRPAEGLLAWDGQSWLWEAGGQRCLGTPHLRLDWQRGLLLEFQPLDAPAAWLWIERGMEPRKWDGLRRALYAPKAPATATASTLEGGGP